MSVDNIPLLIGLSIAFLSFGYLAIKIVLGLLKLTLTIGVISLVVVFVIIAGFWIAKEIHLFTACCN